MKKLYEAPDYETVFFETDDVITTSSGALKPGSNDGAFDDGYMD